MNTINIPVLALRGMTAFPGETVSFDVEREISIFALDNAMEGDRRLFLVTQRKIGVSEPEEQDLYEIGTVCHVLQIIKTSETTVRVLVEGEQRARLHRLWQASPFLQANVELLEDAPYRSTSHTEALLRQTYAIFGAYKELSPQMSDEVWRRCWISVIPPSGGFHRPEPDPAASGPAAGTGSTAPGEAAPAGQ